MTDAEFITWLEAELVKTPDGVWLTLEQRQRLYANSSYVKIKANGGKSKRIDADPLKHRINVWKKRLIAKTTTALLK